jgi:hypothetical protein
MPVDSLHSLCPHFQSHKLNSVQFGEQHTHSHDNISSDHLRSVFAVVIVVVVVELLVTYHQSMPIDSLQCPCPYFQSHKLSVNPILVYPPMLYHNKLT